MNSVNLIGRLTADPQINDRITCAAFTLAVERKYKKQNEQSADFINCKLLGESRAGFANKYLRKGMKIALTGRIQTGSYNGKDGKKIYTTDVVADSVEFAEGKSSLENNNVQGGEPMGNLPVHMNDGFINIPDDIDEELPFK